jgi:hypothetical protein
MICSRPIPCLAVSITITSVVLGDGTPEGVDVISEISFIEYFYRVVVGSSLFRGGSKK